MTLAHSGTSATGGLNLSFTAGQGRVGGDARPRRAAHDAARRRWSRRIAAMKSASLSQKAYAMIMFVAVSVLAGLLLAGLAVPLTALAGGATRAAADSLQYLPAELETPPQSERSKILMADGTTLATFYDENRIYV